MLILRVSLAYFLQIVFSFSENELIFVAFLHVFDFCDRIVGAKNPGRVLVDMDCSVRVYRELIVVVFQVAREEYCFTFFFCVGV